MVGMWLQSPLVGQPDFPLVFFTIFLQMSVGMIVVLLLTKLYRREDVLSADSAALTRQVVNVSLILVIAGSIASLAHLGQPMKSYRALYYHLSSWMGQEVLLVGLFTLSLLAYAIILSRGGSPKPAIEIFAAITGVLSILASSMIYAALASVPSWHSIFTVLFFILSSLFLGASLFAVILIWNSKSGAAPAIHLAENNLKTFTAAFLPLLIAATIITAGYLIYLGFGGPEEKKTLSAMMGSLIFWSRVAVGFLLPFFLMLQLKKMALKTDVAGALSYASAVFVTLLAGELAGRVLFFSTAVMHTIGGSGTPY